MDLQDGYFEIPIRGGEPVFSDVGFSCSDSRLYLEAGHVELQIVNAFFREMFCRESSQDMGPEDYLLLFDYYIHPVEAEEPQRFLYSFEYALCPAELFACIESEPNDELRFDMHRMLRCIVYETLLDAVFAELPLRNLKVPESLAYPATSDIPFDMSGQPSPEKLRSKFLRLIQLIKFERRAVSPFSAGASMPTESGMKYCPFIVAKFFNEIEERHILVGSCIIQISDITDFRTPARRTWKASYSGRKRGRYYISREPPKRAELDEHRSRMQLLRSPIVASPVETWLSRALAHPEAGHLEAQIVNAFFREMFCRESEQDLDGGDYLMLFDYYIPPVEVQETPRYFYSFDYALCPTELFDFVESEPNDELRAEMNNSLMGVVYDTLLGAGFVGSPLKVKNLEVPGEVAGQRARFIPFHISGQPSPSPEELRSNWKRLLRLIKFERPAVSPFSAAASMHSSPTESNMKYCPCIVAKFFNEIEEMHILVGNCIIQISDITDFKTPARGTWKAANYCLGCLSPKSFCGCCISRETPKSSEVDDHRSRMHQLRSSIVASPVET